jgi:cysteine synthase A
MLRITKLFPDCPAHVFGKLELCNPMSVKDRPVKHMVQAALADGRLKPGAELVEASSGNTAIAIAMFGAAQGFPVKIFMSELCSVERWQILNAYGATVILTPGVEHTKGARSRAIAYCDSMIIGLGTSGTFEGLSRFFKEKNPDIQIVGFEPANSPVYSGGEMGKHKLVGIGPGFITDNFLRAQPRIDELIQVKDEDAFAMTKQLVRSEGVFAGITAGASLWVAGELIKRPEYAGKNICCIICDSGERYLSVDGLFPPDNVHRLDC